MYLIFLLITPYPPHKIGIIWAPLDIDRENILHIEGHESKPANYNFSTFYLFDKF